MTPYAAPTVSLASRYIPALPNAGFDPHSGVQLLCAVILVGFVASLLYPYVRKAAAIALR